MRKGINLGEKNSMWKGNNVSYNALHGWVRRNKLKPLLCEECNKREPYDIANISGEYKRDVDDFKWLCRKCHHKQDDKKTPERDTTGRFIKGGTYGK